MTERLYYHDSFQKQFEANVLSCEPEGERWKVVLDRTAFYPTAGGQPHDTGILGEAQVVEVVDASPRAAESNSVVAADPDGSGTVVHYTSAAVPAGPVKGRIDWERRVDHMQQHTAQHLLSAAFIELFGFPTKSFHLGRLISTVDIEAPALSARQIEEAERRTNEIILEDREVVVRFGTAAELAEAGIRKKVEREGVLRAIDIEGFDRQPCGGTHLARTGQAGLLLIRKLERRRDSWRIDYVAGYRALATAKSDFAILSKAASLLTCSLPDVPAGIVKWSEERRAQHSAAKQMDEKLVQHEARELLARHEADTPRDNSSAARSKRVIATTLDDCNAHYLGLLAAKLVAEADVIALLGSSTGHVVFAQAKSLAESTGAAMDMGKLLRETIQGFGGKGGGSKDFAQGSLPNPADVAGVIEHAQNALASK